jgi:hypothetical protein
VCERFTFRQLGILCGLCYLMGVVSSATTIAVFWWVMIVKGA